MSKRSVSFGESVKQVGYSGDRYQDLASGAMLQFLFTEFHDVYEHWTEKFNGLQGIIFIVNLKHFVVCIDTKMY